MVFLCREESCKKPFSTKFNRNKHERSKKHFQEDAKTIREIPFDRSTKLFSCPTIDCTTTSKYKDNVVKHLKSCYKVNMNKKAATDNKTCHICKKDFLKKSNRDRHVKNFHSNQASSDKNLNEDFDLPTMAYDVQEDERPTFLDLNRQEPSYLEEQDEQEPSIIASFTYQQEPTPSFPASPIAATSPNASHVVTSPNGLFSPLKVSRLEAVINKITKSIDYSDKFNICVINHLKKQLKDNKKEAVVYMKECFGLMLDDENFLNWLAKSVGYKPYSLKHLLNAKTQKNRRSNVINHQEIYEFWIQNSITSNDSANSTKRITKMAFLKKFKHITDPEVREEEKALKSGSKVMILATKRIYTDSVRKLHQRFNESCHNSVALSTFFNLKPFYCFQPSEKEKQSCLCINCLNPHVVLKSINLYRISQKLAPHDSLTCYLNKLQSGEKFNEMEAENSCKYYEYKRVVESYIGKDGKHTEYTRTARVDYCEPVRLLVNKLQNLSKKYLKHRTYVDNCTSVFSLMKEPYTGKYIELDFSQNLSLRPKDEAQSAHFSGKQFTLHCAIVEPTEYRYHYHISDDTKHDGIFVDHVLRDIIEKYDIKNEDLWIQSDNASSQYKNKHTFALCQKLAEDFGLRLIRTYGAAGHGKGAIDGMSSFGVKNVLRHDIVTQDVFFNRSVDIVDYLTNKNPHFSYTNVPTAEVTAERCNENIPMEIKNCMKQHMMVFEAGKKVVLKEYLCDCGPCLRFEFEHCEKDEQQVDSDEVLDEEYFDDEDFEENRDEQIFDFVEIPSFVSLFTGVHAEPLYFLKVTDKGIANAKLSDAYGHIILPGTRYFKGNYLKSVRSKNISFKQFEILPTLIVLTPEEIYDTYVDINEKMQLDMNVYNTLLQKARM